MPKFYASESTKIEKIGGMILIRTAISDAEFKINSKISSDKF